MSINPIKEIQGIKFFDNAPACISHFEKLPWTKKALSLIQSLGTYIGYLLNKMSLSLRRIEAKMEPLISTDKRVLSKKRLVVCVHGLNNNPTQFNRILHDLQKEDLSETDLFIPRVLQKGNAKLDDMVNSIFKEIEKWAMAHDKISGKRKLVLVGISNGGRISRALEAKIAKSEISEKIETIRFVSIVGACKGSSLVNLANKIGLSRLMAKNISEEMPTTSKRNDRLNSEWTAGLSIGPKREYTFIASPHDLLVDYDSSLMHTEGQKARYAIISGHRHNSIVNALDGIIAKIILD